MCFLLSNREKYGGQDMAGLIDFTWGHANRGGHHDWPCLMALKQRFFADEGINLHLQVVPGGDALAGRATHCHSTCRCGSAASFSAE
jgi:hypothetical protein